MSYRKTYVSFLAIIICTLATFALVTLAITLFILASEPIMRGVCKSVYMLECFDRLTVEIPVADVACSIDTFLSQFIINQTTSTSTDDMYMLFGTIADILCNLTHVICLAVIVFISYFAIRTALRMCSFFSALSFHFIIPISDRKEYVWSVFTNVQYRTLLHTRFHADSHAISYCCMAIFIGGAFIPYGSYVQLLYFVAPVIYYFVCDTKDCVCPPRVHVIELEEVMSHEISTIQ